MCKLVVADLMGAWSYAIEQDSDPKCWHLASESLSCNPSPYRVLEHWVQHCLYLFLLSDCVYQTWRDSSSIVAAPIIEAFGTLLVQTLVQLGQMSLQSLTVQDHLCHSLAGKKRTTDWIWTSWRLWRKIPCLLQFSHYWIPPQESH